MENPTFIGAILSDVKVIMVIISVLVVEFLCHAVTGWILALECLLLGARGCLWSCLILSGIKWPCCLTIPAPRSLAQYWEPLGVATGGLDTCGAGS
jgi:hypothetical protein